MQADDESSRSRAGAAGEDSERSGREEGSSSVHVVDDRPEGSKGGANGVEGSLALRDNSHLPSSSTTTATADPTAAPAPAPHPMNPLNLHLLSHPTRGNGVFSPRAISAGTLIEESPVLLLSKEEWEKGEMDGTVLGSYGFCWSGGGMAIGLGLASLFNHSPRPNVNFIRSPSTRTIRFITSRRIEPHEELCICYTADESKLWFVPAGESSQRSSAARDHGVDSDEEAEEKLMGMQVEEDEGAVRARKEREERREAARGRGGQGAGGKGKGKEEGEMPANLCAPRPIHPPSSSRSLRQSVPPPAAGSSSNNPSPSVPCPSASPKPQPQPSAILPEPLHSSSHNQTKAAGTRHADKQRKPAELVKDLVFNMDEWQDEKGRDRKDKLEEVGRLGECMRVKGPAERENDGDEQELMQIWIMEFTDPKLTKTALNFTKEVWPNDENEKLRHLKRVCRRQVDGVEYCRIALCPIADHTAESLSTLMASFSPLLSTLTPIEWSVPSSGARTQEQLHWKHKIWPVSFSPAPIIPSSSAAWPLARKAWVSAGIQRVLELGLQAKRDGQLPVATFCTSAPSAFWPNADGFIPPTPNLRACSTDTRVTEAHPLRHATLNCVASIAHLRTVPPFTDTPPTRNGADYLLTSLSLFITHEPCVMCCMALLHSRVREVIYVFSRKRGGGFELDGNGGGGAMGEGGFGVHARRDLNHRFEVWRWDGEVAPEVRKALEIDEELQL
ncbi:hypothetical protein IAT38_007521 [Cryptococcus sp. DSM 104549]